ncbi:unnamed protein product [Rangifer tarandus platyrhynchus]|uniref:Uncharacterized protein n=2 Tax=Rangifer tarandus platyrhynchus TaxID=3082113 RepID=A0AC59ZBG5_RANTA|nr:unnamed protein product [Rangifer tarandus platyrhynchus]
MGAEVSPHWGGTASFPQKRPGRWPPTAGCGDGLPRPLAELTVSSSSLVVHPGDPLSSAGWPWGSVPFLLCPPSSAVSSSLPKGSGTPILCCTSIQSIRGSKSNTLTLCPPFSQDPAALPSSHPGPLRVCRVGGPLPSHGSPFSVLI